MRLNLFLILAFLGGASACAAQGQPDRPVPTAAEVRRILNDPQVRHPWVVLGPFGERLYPAFDAVLSDPATTAYDVGRIFLMLSTLPEMKGDRGRFIPHARHWLTVPDAVTTRQQAAILLGVIGSRSETPPLVALLWDGDPGTVECALKALEKLGGEREQAAIDIWIHAKTKDLRAAEAARDVIRKRVEEEKKKKGG